MVVARMDLLQQTLGFISFYMSPIGNKCRSSVAMRCNENRA
jgi:hypothetical protein